uniref:UPF0481 protein At3g47200-like n=1 Tax=Erigeron canadensis TaxID=72917 RepID=UPI001CB9A967|nr:UPF0481 protein At3g47200-like [Erigeron canadensis]
MANNLQHNVPIDHVNQRPSICTVPSVLRDLSPDSFKPQLVSIGPLHKKETNVQYIDSLKRTYQDDLLNRPTSPPKQPKTKLEDCLEKVNASIAKIKSSYSATEYSEDQLANMMVMDGCFILEFCWKDYKEEPSMLKKLQRNRIAVDLMLLENQIPFFVLQDIFDLTKPDSLSLSLTSLLQKVLLRDLHPFYISPDEFSSPNVLNNSNHVHVLDCLHKIYQFESSEIADARTALNYSHSTVNLMSSGVIFKPQKNKNTAMAMEFVEASSSALVPWGKPTLVMPTLVIQNYTEVVLRNFIAYEQLFPEVNYCFTSYSFAMDKLIDNEADVVKLVESRVLIHHLGFHKEVVKLIKSICKNIEVEQFYYSKEIKALDKYYNSFWPYNLGDLRRKYFDSPWAIMNVLVIYLSLIQTVYAILSYVDKSSSDKR